MEIINHPITEITPYQNNPRKNDNAVNKVAESIKNYGFNQPIVLDKNNIIVVGHTRWKAAQKLKLETVPVIYMPEHVEESKIKAYRIADNKLNELAEWDEELLQIELQELYDELGSIEETGFKNSDILEKEDELYTKKIDTPIYEITGEKPLLTDLYNTEHTNKLLENINKSNLPEEIKTFLTFASYRHIEFRYDLIAEYYAHADKELQELIEESALVIIDFNKAIELGYVQLSSAIEDVYLGIEDEDQEDQA